MSEELPTCEHCGNKPVRVIQFAKPKTSVIGRLCDDCVSVVTKSKELSFPEKIQLLRMRELP
jgi:hypothetical protein